MHLTINTIDYTIIISEDEVTINPKLPSLDGVTMSLDKLYQKLTN